MRRLLATSLAVLFGLFVTWLCLHTLGHIDFPASNHPAVGCTELDHCRRRWWTLPVLLGGMLGPTFIFGCAGYRAASRSWSVARCSVVLGLLVLGTAAFYVSPYLHR